METNGVAPREDPCTSCSRTDPLSWSNISLSLGILWNNISRNSKRTAVNSERTGVPHIIQLRNVDLFSIFAIAGGRSGSARLRLWLRSRISTKLVDIESIFFLESQQCWCSFHSTRLVHKDFRREAPSSQIAKNVSRVYGRI